MIVDNQSKEHKMKLGDGVDTMIRERAKSIVTEIEENTVAGGAGMDEFARYTGDNDSEELMYGILKSAVIHAKYIESSSTNENQTYT